MPLDLTGRLYFAGGMPNPYDVALRERATGDVSPLPKRGGWRSPVDLPTLHAVVQTRADATCEERRGARC